MPMPLSEMEGMAGDLIIYGPRETVRQNMARAGVNVSSQEVDKLWESYVFATVEKGFPPYLQTTGAGPLLAFMRERTGYPSNTVAAYLNGLLEAVQYQGWDRKWIDPAAAVAAGKPLDLAAGVKDKLKTAGESVGAFLKPSLDPVTNLVKYASVALVAGAVIYGIYHGTKLFKGAKRRKG